MIKALLEKQKDYLLHFFDHVDIHKIEEILKHILACQGNVILTGVGKSSLIAKKIAMTWISTGTKAIFLDAMNALHGDIGIISKEDLLICFSKSGETQEILDLFPFVKKRGAKIISIVSNDNSSISKKSDYFISLPLKKELCPFNLAPTTSTQIQLIFGDVVAVALMMEKKFNLQDFAKNHPAGNIGKKVTLKVEEIMIKDNDLPLCKKTDQIIDIIHELSSKKCGAVLVIDDNEKLLGIFTDGDLRRAIEKNKNEFLNDIIENVMTKNPKVTNKDALVWKAMKKMEEDRLITVMPVVEKERVVGLIRMHDIVQAGLSS